MVYEENNNQTSNGHTSISLQSLSFIIATKYYKRAQAEVPPSDALQWQGAFIIQKKQAKGGAWATEDDQGKFEFERELIP